MNTSIMPSIIEDSQGDEDSDYTFEADFIRHRTRQVAFKRELENHYRTMSARRPKRKHCATTASTASSSSLSEYHNNHNHNHNHSQIQTQNQNRRRHEKLPSPSPSALSLNQPSSEDDSEDDILEFLQPTRSSGLRNLQLAAPKLTMADIQERIAKNKARDEEIRRAQELLEETEFSNEKRQTESATANINTYLKSQEGVPAILNVLNPSSRKCDQLPTWSFFGNASMIHQAPLGELFAAIQDSGCISALLRANEPELGVENIRDFLVSGAMVDCLESYCSVLEPPLRQLLLDAVCLRGDEDISFSCFTLVTALHEQFESVLDQKGLQRIFELIGGSRSALDLNKPLVASYREGTPDNANEKSVTYSPSWWNICLVLKMLRNLLQGLTDDGLRITWGLVVRFSLDERRMKERRGQPEFLSLIENLLGQVGRRSNSLVQTILSETLASVTNRAFQVQLLGVLPTTSRFSHDFRKQLARLFFSGNKVYIGPEPSSGILMGSIVAALESKEVRIPKGESHAQLQNVVDIINVSVDDARWCANVVERDEEGQSENLLEKLILHIKHSKEFTQDAGIHLDIEKSNAKDSFAQLIIRLEGVRKKRRGVQTVMDNYFRLGPE
ncbi:hypothetical protein TWF225_006701 [Orbilia oligospora]|nr:hypothetical protein TWF751_007152 [Orbilia oligospora]KAF3181671.1 hypothetical protein TWF225_006701 [Orbilia oligospora]KAF3232819.1 hypothetical protein TWF128_003534 [Orbilia oligospora]KAF3237942.1 hypothetical protein TWF217_002013 [Orbilia oligospora]